MSNILGSVIFDFIGASIKWFFYAVVNRIQGKNIVGFKEMWHGRKGSSSADTIMQGISNIILGIASVLILALLVAKIID